MVQSHSNQHSSKTKSNKKITFEKNDQVFEIENNNIQSNRESVNETNPLCDKKEKVGEYVMDSMPNRPETVMSNDELDDIDIDSGSPNRPDLDGE